MDNRGSKSSLTNQLVKEQRVDDSRNFINNQMKFLRCTLMNFPNKEIYSPTKIRLNVPFSRLFSTKSNNMQTKPINLLIRKEVNPINPWFITGRFAHGC
jgi:hypothetical protein